MMFVLVGYSQEKTSEYVSMEEYSDQIYQINRYNYLQKLRLNNVIDKSDLLQSDIQMLNAKIDSLSGMLMQTVETNRRLSDSMMVAVKQLLQVKAEMKADLVQINSTVESRTGYWEVGLVLMLVVLIAVLVFLLRRYRMMANAFDGQFSEFKRETTIDINQAQSNLDKQLSDMEKTLFQQNNQTKKLVLLNDFMKTLPLSRQGKSRDKKLSRQHNRKNTSNGQNDHSLSLQLANELNSIKQYLAVLPSDTPAVDELKKRYSRVERILKEVGYELIELDGIAVTDELKHRAKLIVPEGIDEGNTIVSRVIVPQINYKDEIIQVAKLEVKPA